MESGTQVQLLSDTTSNNVLTQKQIQHEQNAAHSSSQFGNKQSSQRLHHIQSNSGSIVLQPLSLITTNTDDQLRITNQHRSETRPTAQAINCHASTNMVCQDESAPRQQVSFVQCSDSSSATQQIENRHTMTDSVAESEGRQEAQTIYPMAMQFVQTSEFPGEVYATSASAGNLQNHLQPGTTYTVYHGDGAYSPQVSYYPNSSLSAYQQSLHSPGSAYGVPTQHSGISIHDDDSAAQQLSHTTRASPATIQWLLQNYETAEGVSLPRCTLYGHYLKHCGEHKLDPVNAASFGKLIRSVFLGLRTRRLGTRGNSKYHYYGIRIKPESPLNKLSDENMTMAMRQQPSNPSRRMRSVIAHTTSHSPVSVSSASQRSVQQIQTVSAEANNMSDTMSPGDHYKHLLGAGIVPNIAPPVLGALEPNLQRVGLSPMQADKFFAGYRAHCEEILECIKNLMFNEVECCWRQFWLAEENSPLEDGDDESNRSFSAELNQTGLSRSQLYTICTLQPVLEYIQTMDFHFYQVIADVLIPNVLKPSPSSLTQSIRNFAKRLENGLAVALQGAPEVLVKIKLDAVGSLAQTVRRYTSLNHLAQAARAVLQNPSQISQMLTDLNRVDFRNVQEQASWVCYCNSSQVEDIERSFKITLESQKSLEEWAIWLDSVVDQMLANVCNRPYNGLIHFARQFLLKWSFYSSMVMRDLTLRSAPSFGSFHLIRLLFDEYMFYLIEQRVARVSGQTTVAIMSQSYRHHIDADEMESFTASEFPDPTMSSSADHGHHHQSQMNFNVPFQIVNNTVVSNEGLMTTDGLNVDSQVAPNQRSSSVEVEGYLHDAASEFFISSHPSRSSLEVNREMNSQLQSPEISQSSPKEGNVEQIVASDPATVEDMPIMHTDGMMQHIQTAIAPQQTHEREDDDAEDKPDLKKLRTS